MTKSKLVVDPIFIKSSDIKNPESMPKHPERPEQDHFDFTMGAGASAPPDPKLLNPAIQELNEESRIKQAESEQERIQAEAEALVYIEMLGTKMDDRGQNECEGLAGKVER